MKRKFWGVFLLIVCLISASLFASCDGIGDLFSGAKKHVHDYSTVWASDDENHWHECLNSGCNDPHSGWGAHFDSDENYACDVCGRPMIPDHRHDYQWVDNEDGTHKQHCMASDDETDITVCDAPDINLGEHYFEEDGFCICGADIEESGHEHTLTLVPEVEATCKQGGVMAYYTCSGCTLLFADEFGEIQIRLEDTATEPRGHQPLPNGQCAVCGNIDWEHEGLNLLELSKSTYGYDYLGTMPKGEARQSLYRAIDEKVIAVHEDVETNFASKTPFAQVDFGELALTGQEAVAIWKTYRDDNPLYYWFSNSTAYSGTYLFLYVSEEYLQGSARRDCNQLIYGKIQEYVKYAEAETSIYQIALAYHDKIINAINYAYDNKGQPIDTTWAHSIVGVFQGRGAVCEGYAKTFQLLLNVRGVPNILVDGIGGGGAHAWNMIQLDDGGWYWCDLTWDDVINYGWGIYYGYFCVTSWQGVNWSDGGNQDGTETGEGIGGSPAGCETFLTKHTPYTSSGAGTEFLYDLPAISSTIYEGKNELTLRETFTDSNIEYAVAGYRTVQVTKVHATGAVVIPESVSFGGNAYTVISIGVVGGTKLFGGGDVFNSGVTALTLPSTMRLFWGLTFYNCSFNVITFTGTPDEWNGIIKMKYWKRDNVSLTIRCAGGELTV